MVEWWSRGVAESGVEVPIRVLCGGRRAGTLKNEGLRVEPEAFDSWSRGLDHRCSWLYAVPVDTCMTPVVKVARHVDHDKTLFATVLKTARTIISHELESLHRLFERHLLSREREASAID